MPGDLTHCGYRGLCQHQSCLSQTGWFFPSGQVTRAESSNKKPPLKRAAARKGCNPVACRLQASACDGRETLQPPHCLSGFHSADPQVQFIVACIANSVPITSDTDMDDYATAMADVSAMFAATPKSKLANAMAGMTADSMNKRMQVGSLPLHLPHSATVSMLIGLC